MYILDTSVMRSVGAAALQTLATRADLGVSVISALELASHLSDGPDAKCYEKARANLRKCSILKLIEDPFVLHAERINAEPNPARRHARRAMIWLLEAVARSDTREALAAEMLSFAEKDASSPIGDRIEADLAEEEQRYIAAVKGHNAIIDRFESDFGRSELTPKQLLSIQYSYAQKQAKYSNADFRRCFEEAFLYISYLLARLYKYRNARASGETELKIDKNDCEDAYILMSLDWKAGDILVTNDNGTLAAVRTSIEKINTLLAVPIGGTCIMSGKEFLNLHS